MYTEELHDKQWALKMQRLTQGMYYLLNEGWRIYEDLTGLAKSAVT